MEFVKFDAVSFSDIVLYSVLLSIAYLLALPIAFDRERKTRSAGLRTFPIVAMAACAFMLVGQAVLSEGEAQARLMYGLITGIGFIGGGAIMKNDNQVSGTATAASIWTTGAIGMAVAYRQYAIAIVLSLATFLTLYLGRAAKKQVNGDADEDA